MFKKKNRIHCAWLHIVAGLCLALSANAECSQALKLVVCAPGYPGSTAEAQPAMDGLAAAISTAAGSSTDAFAAEYFETETAGIDALDKQETVFALVTLPFFLEHRQAAGLVAIAQAVAAERSPSEPWTLVAGTGLISSAADLQQWELRSLAGFSPRFIRGPALGSWGVLPESVSITFSGAVLSSLRKAAFGEKVAVLLDGQQALALNRLPFADDLEVIYRTSSLPVSLVCTVGGRASAAESSSLLKALLALDGRLEAAEALAGVRLEKFVDLDREKLDQTVAAFEDVVE